jgi:hypothetical protein
VDDRIDISLEGIVGLKSQHNFKDFDRSFGLFLISLSQKIWIKIQIRMKWNLY